MYIATCLFSLSLLVAAGDDKVGTTTQIATEQARNFGMGHAGKNAAYIQQLRSATLPVTLTDFSLEKNDRSVRLKWGTAAEQGNSHFLLKRSNDSRDFKEIASVQGKGSSAVASSYQYIDHLPLIGENYYQLEQVDFNGNTTTFNIISTNYQIAKREIYSYISSQGYITTAVNASKSADAVITILNTNGQVLNKANIKVKQGLNEYRFDGVHLNSGVYVVSVRTDHETITQKLIK